MNDKLSSLQSLLKRRTRGSPLDNYVELEAEERGALAFRLREFNLIGKVTVMVDGKDYLSAKFRLATHIDNIKPRKLELYNSIFKSNSRKGDVEYLEQDGYLEIIYSPPIKNEKLFITNIRELLKQGNDMCREFSQA